MSAAWWKHTTVYQIHPRSFADGDGPFAVIVLLSDERARALA
jgi:hypothetical protein